MELKSRLAFVTGGARGIGFAFARECAARGMHVVLTDYDAGKLEDAANLLRGAGAQVTSYPLDVTDIARYRAVATDVMDRFGAPYVLFNNAGVALHGSVSEGTPEDWQWHVNVNVLGVGYGLSLFTKAMIASGQKGYIVNTASITGLVSSAAGAGIYGTTKHAVVALSEALMFDVRPHGMHVCVLCPGSVHTDIADSDRHTHEDAGKGLTPVSDAQRGATRMLVANGLSPDKLMAQVFAAMESRRFYVVSHPEYRNLIASRHRQIENSVHGDAASDTFLVNATEAALAAFPTLDQPNVPLAKPEAVAAEPKPAIDLGALRKRYAHERDKRVRQDGITQYIETAGEFSYFVDDPYAAPAERPAQTGVHDVVIVGGGFGGLLTAVHLANVGVTDVRIIERGGAFGGTWYWNRYPGLACDMKSYVYLPLLEETGYIPPRNYASGTEIRVHAERIATQWGLHEKALFQTGVTAARWIEDENLWAIETDKGDAIKARFLVTAHGPLSKPKLPGIPGITSFRGHTFHTSRWDYAYTGGSSEGGLAGLAGKRVAIIGTGATAVQCIPHLAEHAERLYVVQRTPSGVDVREEKPTDPDWVAQLQPGWHQELMDNFNILTSGGAPEKDLIDDGWTFLFQKMGMAARKATSMEQVENAAEMADAEKMEEIRARIESIVADPETAELLKPWYRRFCKRPVFHDGFLETFNRPNVELVDTDGHGVNEITPTGFVVAGRHYEVDCIIFASGFEVGTSFARRAGYDIFGTGGGKLEDKWAKSFATFHGMHVNGFPNMFIHQNAQGALPANFCHGLAEGAKHMGAIIAEARRRNAIRVEATDAAEREWVEHCLSVSGAQIGFLNACTPGYYNAEGFGLTKATAQGFGYGLGPAVFFRLMENWRADGLYAGLEFAG